MEFCFLLFLILNFKNLNLMVWHVTHLGFFPAPNNMPILSRQYALLVCLSEAVKTHFSLAFRLTSHLIMNENTHFDRLIEAKLDEVRQEEEGKESLVL